MNSVILYFSKKYNNDFHLIYRAIEKKEFVPVDELVEIKNNLESKVIKAITIIDEDYPESLKTFMNPPFVIYYGTEVNNRNREETIKLINSKVVELNFQDKEVKSFLKSIDPFSNKVSLAN